MTERQKHRKPLGRKTRKAADERRLNEKGKGAPCQEKCANRMQLKYLRKLRKTFVFNSLILNPEGMLNPRSTPSLTAVSTTASNVNPVFCATRKSQDRPGLRPQSHCEV